MHEFAVTQSLFEIVLKQAENAGAKKITGVNMVLGALTGVVGDSVQFYFEFLSKNTPAEGAKLNIKTTPARARCNDCGTEFEVHDMTWFCPLCHNINLEITGGKELLLESIDIE